MRLSAGSIRDDRSTRRTPRAAILDRAPVAQPSHGHEICAAKPGRSTNYWTSDRWRPRDNRPPSTGIGEDTRALNARPDTASSSAPTEQGYCGLFPGDNFWRVLEGQISVIASARTGPAILFCGCRHCSSDPRRRSVASIQASATICSIAAPKIAIAKLAISAVARLAIKPIRHHGRKEFANLVR